jgi:hypothetical protein
LFIFYFSSPFFSLSIFGLDQISSGFMRWISWILTNDPTSAEMPYLDKVYWLVSSVSVAFSSLAILFGAGIAGDRWVFKNEDDILTVTARGFIAILISVSGIFFWDLGASEMNAVSLSIFDPSNAGGLFFTVTTLPPTGFFETIAVIIAALMGGMRIIMILGLVAFLPIAASLWAMPGILHKIGEGLMQSLVAFAISGPFASVILALGNEAIANGTGNFGGNAFALYLAISTYLAAAIAPTLVPGVRTFASASSIMTAAMATTLTVASNYIPAAAGALIGSNALSRTTTGEESRYLGTSTLRIIPSRIAKASMQIAKGYVNAPLKHFNVVSSSPPQRSITSDKIDGD